MPRRLLGALVALALIPGSASALTPSITVRSVAAGCSPRGAFAVPVSGAPAFAAGPHTYVVAAGDATPCAELPVTTTASARAVRLRWTATPGATDYRVYRDGATVAAAVACCSYTDTSAATTTGAPPPVAAESERAGSGPDLTVAEAFAYDGPDETLKTDVVRLPAGLFLPGPVTGEALAVISGKTVPGDIAATDDASRLTLTLRPDGADPIVLPMTLDRRADGALDVTTAVGDLRLDALSRTFVGPVLPTSCAAKSVLLDADGAHASAPFQATDCEAVPFAPVATLRLDGTTLTADVTQPSGQAAARAIAFTLPEGYAAPGGGGQATGTSPFAPVAPLPFTATTTAGGRSVLTLDGLPEAPLGDVRFSTQVTRAPCAGAPVADATFAGHNGAVVGARPAITVAGPLAPCADDPGGDGGDDPPAQLPARPGVAVAARVGRSGRPRLTLTIRAGNAVAGSSLRRCRVRLPRGLRLTRRAQRHLTSVVDASRAGSTTVHPHRLTVRTAKAARILTVTARPGALAAGRRARRRLVFHFAVLTQSGRTYRIVKRVTPRS